MPPAHRSYTLVVDGLSITVTHKAIKNLNLRIQNPSGNVVISAPLAMPKAMIKDFVQQKLHWIQAKQQHLQNRPQPAVQALVNGETVRVFGTTHTLKITEKPGKPSVNVCHGVLELVVADATNFNKKQAVLQAWQRAQLKQRAPELIDHYTPLMNVTVREFGIKKMKTRWGTCNPRAERIWLNLALAEKPIGCLEYVVVHEMAHLLEPSHNSRFWGLVEQFMPNWQTYKQQLKT